MENNGIMFEILEDGTISITTGSFGKTVHQSADDFLADIEKLLGGTKTVKKIKHKHQHTHNEIKHSH